MKIGEDLQTNIIVNGNTYTISDDDSKNNFFNNFPNLNNLDLSDCNLILYLITREDYPTQNNDSLDTDTTANEEHKINLFNDLIYYWTNQGGYNVSTEITWNKESIKKDNITINYTKYANGL